MSNGNIQIPSRRERTVLEARYIEGVNNKIAILQPDNLILEIDDKPIKYGNVITPYSYHYGKIAAYLLLENVLNVKENGQLCIDIYFMKNIPVNPEQSIVINPSFMPTLLKIYLCDKTWGVIKWVIFYLNMKPSIRTVHSMKMNRVWDDDMESLPDNRS